jgi:hypothetical protein
MVGSYPDNNLKVLARVTCMRTWYRYSWTNFEKPSLSQPVMELIMLEIDLLMKYAKGREFSDDEAEEFCNRIQASLDRSTRRGYIRKSGIAMQNVAGRWRIEVFMTLVTEDKGCSFTIVLKGSKVIA